MNDKQREYLMKTVKSTFDGEVKSLEQSKRKKPSLNNYLIAAFLDNSIEFADIENLKSKMREAVIKMPSEAKLLETDNKSWNEDAKETGNVKIPVQLIFKIPEAYVEELRLWQDEEDNANQKIQQLKSQLKTIEVKIQLGSNQQLDKLIQEADNLGEISLINSRLMLTS